MARMLSYSDKGSAVHSLSGTTKLLYFLIWSLASMITYDTRLLIFMLGLSFVIFKISRVEFADIAFVLKLIMLFLSINLVAIFIFSPEEGVEIYHNRTLLVHIIGNYNLTAEQLFYELNVALKYFTIIPIALLFIMTTNPSEFASALNKIGISYRLSYAVAITLRYIPDMQRDYITVSQAQQARGIDMSEKAGLIKRMKNVAAVLIPLFFSSMDRIDTISNAMELRGFGKKNTRTWYAAKKLKKQDFAVIISLGVLVALVFLITFADGGRFYNPFL